jgi:hypothetical protein
MDPGRSATWGLLLRKRLQFLEFRRYTKLGRDRRPRSGSYWRPSLWVNEVMRSGGDSRLVCYVLRLSGGVVLLSRVL